MFDSLRESAAPLGAAAQAVAPDPWESPELRAELEAEYQAVLLGQWAVLDSDGVLNPDGVLDSDGPLDPEGWQPGEGPGYADTEPSGWLALELDSGTADVAVRSEAGLLEAVVGFDRVASWALARQAGVLAELAARRAAVPRNDDRCGLAGSFLADEVAVALRLSTGAGSARLDQAIRLAGVLPETLAVWQSGRIDGAKARLIAEATDVVSDELARAVQARVLPAAPRQSWAQLRAALAKAILAVDPRGASERHRQARTGRRVWVSPEAEGMACLGALLSAPTALAAYEWVSRLARGLGSEDGRSMDARRADVLAALLTGQVITDADITLADTDTDTITDANADADADGRDDADGRGAEDTGAASDGSASEPVGAHDASDTGGASGAGSAAGSGAAGAGGAGPARQPGRPRARRSGLRPVTPGKPLIQIVMPHSTLTGADDRPADLTGYGPIPAELAREIAVDAVWRRLVADPLSGSVLDYGRTTYRPPAALADFVRARDRYCRGPLCGHTAANCELDHAVAWADDGPTSADNLNPFCKHDHRLKTYGRWRIEIHPDGSLTWVTPTGLRHTTMPYDYRDPPPEPEPPPPPPTPPPHDPERDPPPF